MKRVISIILLLCMVVTILPSQAFAEEVFTVDYNLTNVIATVAPSTVTSGTAINATIIADEGYELPDAIEVNGDYESFNYQQSSGNIEINNVQSNLEIVAEGMETVAETELGTIVLKFEDEVGNELLTEDILSDMGLGEYSFQAPLFEGYTADKNSQTVTLTTNGEIKYLVFTYTADEIVTDPIQEGNYQLRLVLVDCTDIQDEKDSLDIFMERSINEEHNILQEIYYDLTVGDNFISIPQKYNDIEMYYEGNDDWDSSIESEIIEGNESEQIFRINIPYLTNLNYYVGYIKTEEEIIEEPIVEESKEEISPSTNNSKPKKEENIPTLKDIKQEDFIARWLEHKRISDELKKFNNKEVEFKLTLEELGELKKVGLEPRIYKWNEAKGKLIAEATSIEVGAKEIILKHLSDENNPKNFYAVYGVKQPKFEDVSQEENSFTVIDKANGLGIIEGIEKENKTYFEGSKTISKSEYYTMVARIFGAMPDGEMKMYDILDLKTMEEAEEILAETEIVLDDWAKPYIASLLEKGYIFTTDLKNNQFNFSTDFALVERLISVAENKQEAFNLEVQDTRLGVVKSLLEVLKSYGW